MFMKLLGLPSGLDFPCNSSHCRSPSVLALLLSLSTLLTSMPSCCGPMRRSMLPSVLAVPGCMSGLWMHNNSHVSSCLKLYRARQSCHVSKVQRHIFRQDHELHSFLSPFEF